MAGENAELKNEMAVLHANLNSLQQAIQACQKTVDDIPRDVDKEFSENRRVRFQDSGDWGRHYSTVRMTVTTFLLGLSLGIISFKWDNLQEPPAAMLVALSTLIWISAVALFIVFTRLTYHEMVRARKLDLRDTAVDNRKTLYPRRDPASWVLIIVTLVFGISLSLVCNSSVLPSLIWTGGTMHQAIYQYGPWIFVLAAASAVVDRLFAFEEKPQ